jgi:hypothetical protein
MLFPLQLIKARMGILAGVAVLTLLSIGLVKIPNDIWFPVIQMIIFSCLLILVSPSLLKYLPKNPILTSIIKDPVYALIPAAFIVSSITLFQLVSKPSRKYGERFVGDERALGRTPIKPPNPFCPPRLDFTNDKIDTDTERQMPACLADSNKLTEEQQLDEIDIYLRDAQESIARINGYLNVSRPDERWLSKKEMDDPENARLEAKNFTLV